MLAAGVDHVSGGDDDTGSVIKAIALITLFADSDVLVEDSALRMDLAADSVCIEIEVG